MTSVALILAPLTCAVVLLISGGSKVRDTTATREAFASMGVPAPLRSDLIVKALPYAEMALGILLVVTWSWPMMTVALVATALFAAYWVLVLRVLQRGEAVDCGCFGALGDDRISGATLARNSLLVAFGALAVAFGSAGSGVIPALQDFRSTDWWWLVLTVAVAATAVLVAGLSGPDPAVAEEDLLDYERVPIPFGLLENEAGARTTLKGLAVSRPQLLVLLSTTCGTCTATAKQLPDWSARLGPVKVSTVFTAPLRTIPKELRADDLQVWFDVEHGVTDTFASTGRPAAVLLGIDGQLAGGPVAGAENVASFVQDILAELEAAPQMQEEPSGTEPAAVMLGGHDHHHGDDGHGHNHQHSMADGHGHA